MAITVTFDPNAEENRKYVGICQSCSRTLEWVAADAITVHAADGLTPAHSVIACPLDDEQVTGRLM